jgi:DNA repair exonuclease SbcCD ATPase subunit
MTTKRQEPSRLQSIEALQARTGTFEAAIVEAQAEQQQAQAELEAGDTEALERITQAGSKLKALQDALQTVTARLAELEREQTQAELAAAHKQTVRELAGHAKDATLALSDLLATRKQAGEALTAAVSDILAAYDRVAQARQAFSILAQQVAPGLQYYPPGTEPTDRGANRQQQAYTLKQELQAQGANLTAVTTGWLGGQRVIIDHDKPMAPSPNSTLVDMALKARLAHRQTEKAQQKTRPAR